MILFSGVLLFKTVQLTSCDGARGRIYIVFGQCFIVYRKPAVRVNILSGSSFSFWEYLYVSEDETGDGAHTLHVTYFL